MEKEPVHRMPKGARYPLFLAGLLVIIFGNLAANTLGAALGVEEALSVGGFLLIFLSVAIR